MRSLSGKPRLRPFCRMPHTAHRSIERRDKYITSTLLPLHPYRQLCHPRTATMELLTLLLPFLLLVLPAAAQFQFFEQMFGGQQPGQQARPQNAGSDSAWYQQQYEDGTHSLPPRSTQYLS